MKILEIFAFILCLSLSFASIVEIPFQQKNINYTHLLCLKGRGLLDDFFISGQLESTETFKFFISSVDFDGLNTYELMPHFNISLVDLIFYNSPEVTAAFYSATLEKYYYKMLWFDVAHTLEDQVTCEKLWTLISLIERTTKSSIGIIGNKKSWAKKFGSESSCSQFSSYPLFYNGDGEFQPFAGWTSFAYRDGPNHSGSCNLIYSDVFPSKTTNQLSIQ